jgi:hypothetical protein
MVNSATRYEDTLARANLLVINYTPYQLYVMLLLIHVELHWQLKIV